MAYIGSFFKCCIPNSDSFGEAPVDGTGYVANNPRTQERYTNAFKGSGYSLGGSSTNRTRRDYGEEPHGIPERSRLLNS